MDEAEYSQCCGAPRDARYETDFCSECHDHATFETAAEAEDRERFAGLTLAGQRAEMGGPNGGDGADD